MKAQKIKRPKPIRRDKNSHKGTYGTALFICGSYGMSGAVIMASLAALRSGLGIAKIAIPDKIYDIVAKSVPEAVCVPCATSDMGTFCKTDAEKIVNEAKNCSVIVIGCGISNSQDNEEILAAVIKNAMCPIIIDADGINLLSHNIDIIKQTKASVILTPHPGEMSRLCKKSVAEIEKDRIGTAVKFSHEYGVITVLKGHKTIVATPKGCAYINTTGNAGMATGGSGDVLAGVIAAFVARSNDTVDAVKSAVYVHGAAGDLAAKYMSQTSLLPRDLIEQLPCLFKKLEG